MDWKDFARGYAVGTENYFTLDNFSIKTYSDPYGGFPPQTTEKKKKQTISSPKSFTKTYGNKACSLGAKAKGKLTYESSNTKVAKVSSAGKVTVKGTGKTIITITAAATAKYKKATKKVTVTVRPKKAASVKVKKGKKQMTVSWKKDNKATGTKIYGAYSSVKTVKVNRTKVK